MKKNFFTNLFKQTSIGRNLLLWIVFFSSVITLLLSCLQLYIDYRVGVNAINNRLDEIEKVYTKSIALNLWNVDVDQLTTQLDGIVRLPDIQAATVEEKSNVQESVIVEKGNFAEKGIVRKYILNYQTKNSIIELGVLTVQASLENVYQGLINKALTILFTQGIKTFFVSLFILYIFYRLVTRHIIAIGNFLKDVDLKGQIEPMVLVRSQANSDELDYLVDTYNMMSTNLQTAYSELQEANRALEKDIVARRVAEAEVKKLNDELESRVRQRTAELEAANQELGSFCYSVSHDLRAPLRRIEGFRRIIESDYAENLDETALHYIRRIEVGTNDMNEMIESFLKLSKSTSVELVVEEISLSKMFKRAISRVTDRNDNRDVDITVQDDIVVSGDEKLLDLLVTNLVDNAFKYTRNEVLPKIAFYQDKNQAVDTYVIEDNGVGFNMDYAGKLFSPFTRLHQGDTFEGIGIGLATVQRVVARHGGHVWAESSVDNGAKFFFTLWNKGNKEAR